MPKTTKINDLAPEGGFDMPPQRSVNLQKKYLPWLILLLVIIAGAAFALMQHKQTKMLQKQISDLKQNPQQATEEETKALLDKVGQLIELPSEQPTVATVTDLTPLKDQPFFAHAQIGDKVLIFSQAQKAVLYRPSTNKVIEIAPVNLNGGQNPNTTKTSVDTNTNSSSNTNPNKNSNSSTSTKNTNSNTSIKTTK